MSAKKSRKKSTRIPSLRECNRRGFVELNGRRINLGPWGAPETKQAYERTVAEWLNNDRRLRPPHGQITVVELSLLYWCHCSEYYRRPDGTPSSTIDAIRQALRPLRRLYGNTLAAEFRPNALRTLRKVA